MASGYGSNLDTPRHQAREGRLFICRAARRIPRLIKSLEVSSGGTMGVTRRSCPEAQTANRRELAVERAAKKDAVETLNGLFKTTRDRKSVV